MFKIYDCAKGSLQNSFAEKVGHLAQPADPKGCSLYNAYFVAKKGDEGLKNMLNESEGPIIVLRAN